MTDNDNEIEKTNDNLAKDYGEPVEIKDLYVSFPPEVKRTKNDKEIASCSVSKRISADGVVPADYVNYTLKGLIGKNNDPKNFNLVANLAKGQIVNVWGNLKEQEYTNKDGKLVRYKEIIVDDLEARTPHAKVKTYTKKQF